VRTAKNLEEACKLVEVGFNYVTEMDGAKIFRKTQVALPTPTTYRKNYELHTWYLGKINALKQ